MLWLTENAHTGPSQVTKPVAAAASNVNRLDLLSIINQSIAATIIQTRTVHHQSARDHHS
jgi:hypothetical protein